MTFLEENAEREKLTQQAFLNAIPSYIADRIVCRTLTQLPSFLNLNGRGAMTEPYESKFRELCEEIERKLAAKYPKVPLTHPYPSSKLSA